MKRIILFLLLLLVFASTVLVFYVRRELRMPQAPATSLIVEIPRGLGASEVIQLLQQKGVIRSRYVALTYLVLTRNRHRLQAGEYLFDRPVTIPEVVDKLTRGAVYLYKFTVPEGLTVQETAQRWQDQGFGTIEEFLSAASRAVERVHRFDDEASSVEGYLFPETYSFPKHTTSDQAIKAMISRFEQTLERLKTEVPASNWSLNLHDTVVLASLVESESAHDEERPLIASVYQNRLDRHMLLQCDPTVIYALERADQYRGLLTLADLRFDSPYNTYLNPGLPPGPISNPGYASLRAAVQPANTKYLFFVRASEEGHHTFSETLAAHNRAVTEYRKSVKH